MSQIDGEVLEKGSLVYSIVKEGFALENEELIKKITEIVNDIKKANE